ncbi:MAG: hypothetical protein ACOCXX_05240, partial [Planctomycetota bacterium]
IKLTCRCGEVFFFQDRLAGHEVRCSSCGTVNVLPGQPVEHDDTDDPAPLSALKDTQVRGLASVVNDEDTTPHLKATVGRLQADQRARPGTLVGRLTTVTSTVGMVSILLGVVSVMAGTAGVIYYYGGGDRARPGQLGWGVVLLLLGVVAGMGGGLVLVMLGDLFRKWDAVLIGRLKRLSELKEHSRGSSAPSADRRSRRSQRRSTG